MSDEKEEEEREVDHYVEMAKLLTTLIDTPSLDTLIPDKSLVSSYKTLTDAAQLLYIRLYLRKRNWLKHSTFSYPGISDAETVTMELVTAGFLIRLCDSCDSLTVSDMLKSMTAREVKEVCVFFNVKSSGSMRSMETALLRLCKGQRTLFGGKGAFEKRVRSKCIEKLSDMVKISPSPANVFARMLIASFPQFLFTFDEEDSNSGIGKENLNRILLSHIGLSGKYPSYTVRYSKPVFRSSHHLEVFVEACQLESVCLSHVQEGRWTELKCIYSDHISRYESCMETWESGDHTLPAECEYLEHFTEEWVLTRVMRHCLAALRRLKDYKTAVTLLETLLKYRPMRHRRGVWWDTLAMIQDFHLKDGESAAISARKGLADPATTHGSRLALELRLAKLDTDYKPQQCFEPREVTIDIVTVEGAGSAANSKRIFITSQGGDTVLSNVEDAALTHYKNEHNFKEGFHCEGAIISTLFAMLCWDIIFCDIDSVFYNDYQCHPLDFWSTEFYTRRKDEFDTHFAMLRELSETEMTALIGESWSKHREYCCVGLSWELFSDVSECQRCVSCMTPASLVSVFEVFVTDTRLRRSGLPDLSIWNHETRDFVMVEVKGPGDSLRNNQRVWLSVLERAGIRAEVCHVRAVSSKRLDAR